MEKEQFNKLNIEKQIEYFNKKIKELGSSSAASRSLSYKDESTIRKRFKSKGYHLNSEKTTYILINKGETIVNNKSNTKVNDNKIANKNNSETLDNKGLKELLVAKDDILAVVKLYRSNTIACDVSNEIKIDTERIKDEAAITKGLKTYPSVIIEFKEFCNKHKEYRMQDLIAMSFLEYIGNHS